MESRYFLTRIFTLVGVLILIFSVGCKKDEVNKDLYPEGLICLVDGTSWTANISLTANKVGSLLTIVGENSDGSIIRVNIEDLTPGTYIINSFTNISIYQNYGFNFTPLNSDQGTLVINTHDSVLKKVEGTFTFTGDNGQGDRVYITDGTINLIYTEN